MNNPFVTVAFVAKNCVVVWLVVVTLVNKAFVAVRVVTVSEEAEIPAKVAVPATLNVPPTELFPVVETVPAFTYVEVRLVEVMLLNTPFTTVAPIA